MARTIHDNKLDTRTARARLKARGKPYFRTLDAGLHVGYRKNRSGGMWVMRRYIGGQAYKTETIGTADDIQDADGAVILNFHQAQAKARELFILAQRKDAGLEARSGPYTVANAITDYLDHLDAQGKPSLKDASYRANAAIIPVFGQTELSRLRASEIEKWLNTLATSPARLRTKAGERQKFRQIKPDDTEASRQRRANANRTFTVLRAALNLAYARGNVSSDAAWRRIKPFKGADAARIRYLQVAEAKRLVNACPPDFRALVRAALYTGARYGELARLDVADYNADSGTVRVRQSKSGHPRSIYLTDEGRRFFETLTVGKPGSAIMLPKADGNRWGAAHQRRPMLAACAAAKIEPPMNFHALRHTWASLAVMAGAPLQVVAANLGHSDTRMVEKHYGHLSDTFIAKTIRETAPEFGFRADKKIARLERARG